MYSKTTSHILGISSYPQGHHLHKMLCCIHACSWRLIIIHIIWGGGGLARQQQLIETQFVCFSLTLTCGHYNFAAPSNAYPLMVDLSLAGQTLVGSGR